MNAMMRGLKKSASKVKWYPWRKRTLEMLEAHNQKYGAPRLLVIGAAGGVGWWDQWARTSLISAAGVEPNKVECERLNQRDKHVRFYPFALGDINGPATLNVAKSSECSSLLEADMEVLSQYPIGVCFEIQDHAQIELHRFADLTGADEIPTPDYLQVDVQGFEYQVLDGFGDKLDGVSCIEFETHFKSIYKKQKLFGDIKAMLEERGFVLRHINGGGPFGAELVEINAFFVRSPAKMDKKTESLTRVWEQVLRIPPRPVFDISYKAG